MAQSATRDRLLAASTFVGGTVGVFFYSILSAFEGINPNFGTLTFPLGVLASLVVAFAFGTVFGWLSWAIAWVGLVGLSRRVRPPMRRAVARLGVALFVAGMSHWVVNAPGNTFALVVCAVFGVISSTVAVHIVEKYTTR